MADELRTRVPGQSIDTHCATVRSARDAHDGWGRASTTSESYVAAALAFAAVADRSLV